MKQLLDRIEDPHRRQRYLYFGGGLLAFLFGVVLAMLTGCAPP